MIKSLAAALQQRFPKELGDVKVEEALQSEVAKKPESALFLGPSKSGYTDTWLCELFRVTMLSESPLVSEFETQMVYFNYAMGEWYTHASPQDPEEDEDEETHE